MHVDDFLHIGNAYFVENVIERLRKAFLVGSTGKEAFSYIGLDVVTSESGIVLTQSKFVDKLRASPLSVDRRTQKDSKLDKYEHEQFRKTVGQLNWAAQHTRPDLVFEVLELSMKLTKPCVQDYARAIKALRKLQSCDVGVFIPNLGDFGNWKLIVFTDAAFANLFDKVSSASGYIVFLVDSNLNCSPLCWKSANKIKRKVRSTLAAEALALEMGIEHAIFFERTFEGNVYNIL